ncbi:hypothetical protein T10_4578, partial [Trichinella papuae]
LTMQGFGGVLKKFDNLKLTSSDKKTKNKSSSRITYSKDDFMKIKQNVTVKKTWKPMLELCNQRFIEKLLFEEDETYSKKYECFREGYAPNKNAEALIEAANRRAMQPMPQRYVRSPRMPTSNQGHIATYRHASNTFMNRGNYFYRPLSAGMGSGYNSRWGNTQSFAGDNVFMYGEQKGRQTFTDGYDNYGAQFHFDELPSCGDRKRFGRQFYDLERFSGKCQAERAYNANRFALNSDMRPPANWPRDMDYHRRVFGQSYEGIYSPPFMQRGYHYSAFAPPEEERMLCSALVPFDYKVVTDAVLRYNVVDIHPKLMDLIKNYHAISTGKPPDTLKMRKIEEDSVEMEAKFEKEIFQRYAEIVLKDVQVLESASGSFKQAKPKAKASEKKNEQVGNDDKIYLKIPNAETMNGYYSPREILMLIKVGIVEMTSELKLPGCSEFQTLRDVLRAHGTVPGLEEELNLLPTSSKSGLELLWKDRTNSKKLFCNN